MSNPKKPFNPWPYGIFGGYTLFAILIMSLGLTMARKRVDLVTPNYYPAQIRYEDRIDAARAAMQPGHAFVINPVENGMLSLMRPAAATNELAGTVTLYRPSDKNMDQTFPIVFEDSFSMRIPVVGLRSGVWKIKLQWETDETPHYQETNLYLP